MDAYRAVLRGTSPESPRAWLLAIAENVRRRRFRTAQRRPSEVPLHDDAAPAAEGAHEQAAALAAALAGLPEQQREAFVLREISGLAYDEIARRTGSTVASVQMLLFRARRIAARGARSSGRGPAAGGSGRAAAGLGGRPRRPDRRARPDAARRRYRRRRRARGRRGRLGGRIRATRPAGPGREGSGAARIRSCSCSGVPVGASRAGPEAGNGGRAFGTSSGAGGACDRPVGGGRSRCAVRACAAATGRVGGAAGAAPRRGCTGGAGALGPRSRDVRLAARGDGRGPWRGGCCWGSHPAAADPCSRPVAAPTVTRAETRRSAPDPFLAGRRPSSAPR